MIEITAGFNESASGFGHFLAVDGEKPVGINGAGCSEIRPGQHGGPEKGVKVNDILANKMIKFSVTVLAPIGIKIDSLGIAQVFETVLFCRYAERVDSRRAFAARDDP